MNALDIVFAALCALLAVLGLFQGFVRQAASWTGLILGHIAGVKYNAPFQKFLSLEFPRGDIIAYLLALFTVYVAVRLVGLLIERWVRGTKLSGSDRFFGALAGLAKGIVLSILLLFVLVVVLPRDSALIARSKAAPRLMVAAHWMERIFPERIREAFREKAGGAGAEKGVEKEAVPQRKNRPRK
jgi:membrane protein required for colicin V production